MAYLNNARHHSVPTTLRPSAQVNNRSRTALRDTVGMPIHVSGNPPSEIVVRKRGAQRVSGASPIQPSYGSYSRVADPTNSNSHESLTLVDSSDKLPTFSQYLPVTRQPDPSPCGTAVIPYEPPRRVMVKQRRARQQQIDTSSDEALQNIILQLRIYLSIIKLVVCAIAFFYNSALGVGVFMCD